MPTATEKYRLLAFALMIKKSNRVNGMWYEDESLSDFRKALGLGLTAKTFNKYWNLLEMADLVKPRGKHLQLVGIEEIVERLDITWLQDIFLTRLIKESRENITGMDIIQAGDFLMILTALVNYRAQDFKLKSTQNFIKTAQTLVPGRNSYYSQQAPYKLVRKLVRKASKMGMSTLEYAQRLLGAKDEAVIKSGSYHLAKILGVSQRKGNRLLNKMDQLHLIRREKIFIKHKLPVNDGTFHFLKNAPDVGIFFPVKDGFLEPKGSKITLPDSGMYFLKEKQTVKMAVIKSGYNKLNYGI